MMAFHERRRFTPAPRAHYRPDFTQYEREKAQWVADNPKAAPEQYQAAMREIAIRCGI